MLMPTPTHRDINHPTNNAVFSVFSCCYSTEAGKYHSQLLDRLVWPSAQSLVSIYSLLYPHQKANTLKIKRPFFLAKISVFYWLSILCPCIIIGKSEIPGSNPALAFKSQRNKTFLPRSLVKIQYCGEHPWPRVSVLGLRSQGLEFWILFLEDSVISFISPSSGGYPGPV